MATESSRNATRELFWRKQIARQLRSGLSQVEFCRRNRLVHGTLGWWKREIKRRENGGGSRSARHRGFVPVRVVTRAPITGSGEGTFDVEFRNGRRIRVRSPFDSEVLQQLIAILEPPTC